MVQLSHRIHVLISEKKCYLSITCTYDWVIFPGVSLMYYVDIYNYFDSSLVVFCIYLYRVQ